MSSNKVSFNVSMSPFLENFLDELRKANVGYHFHYVVLNDTNVIIGDIEFDSLILPKEIGRKSKCNECGMAFILTNDLNQILYISKN